MEELQYPESNLCAIVAYLYGIDTPYSTVTFIFDYALKKFKNPDIKKFIEKQIDDIGPFYYCVERGIFQAQHKKKNAPKSLTLYNYIFIRDDLDYLKHYNTFM